ncbi:LRR domain containing protein [Trema orientale]|uniref:LRR domain containing protein n=1 Tax=Trema orientale TaxID=63057 RepID=A0A2P5G271_TREOI|nr:LRR domain containing protein [Trema orientale]
MEWMCRQAVDFSSGQLVEVCLHGFGSDDLIHYITERSREIKRLRLFCTHSKISDKALTKAAPKLSLLEELELSEGSFSKESLQAIGRHCPHLKSLKFNFQGYEAFSRNITSNEEVILNEQSVPIAGYNVPKLGHLEHFRNVMTDVGLQAILDGCPLLETLELYYRFDIKMGGDLEKRCDEQLKCLYRPFGGPSSYVGDGWRAWISVDTNHFEGNDSNHAEDDEDDYERNSSDDDYIISDETQYSESGTDDDDDDDDGDEDESTKYAESESDKDENTKGNDVDSSQETGRAC